MMVSRERLSDHVSRLEYYVGQHPWQSVAVALGAGLILALARAPGHAGDQLAEEMARVGDGDRLRGSATGDA